MPHELPFEVCLGLFSKLDSLHSQGRTQDGLPLLEAFVTVLAAAPGSSATVLGAASAQCLGEAAYLLVSPTVITYPRANFCHFSAGQLLSFIHGPPFVSYPRAITYPLVITDVRHH